MVQRQRPRVKAPPPPHFATPMPPKFRARAACERRSIRAGPGLPLGSGALVKAVKKTDGLYRVPMRAHRMRVRGAESERPHGQEEAEHARPAPRASGSEGVAAGGRGLCKKGAFGGWSLQWWAEGAFTLLDISLVRAH